MKSHRTAPALSLRLPNLGIWHLAFGIPLLCTPGLLPAQQAPNPRTATPFALATDRDRAYAEAAEPDQRVFAEKIANVTDKDADKIVEEIFHTYEQRASGLDDAILDKSGKVPSIPPGADFWWDGGVRRGLSGASSPFSLGLEELYVRTIKNSTQIKVFADLPLIRETGIQEARGAFDTQAFAEVGYRHDDKPVGSTLQTGGAARFEEEGLESKFGLRKKIITGATVEVSQSFNHIDNNSIYFVPDPQGQTELALKITQPLLQSAGVGYNRSVMEIARLDTKMALSEFVRQTESHLLEVNRAYWGLYLARAIYIEKLRLARETNGTVDEINSRKDLDSVLSQQIRAQSAFSERNADTIRAELSVKNAEARIKALVNDPVFYTAGSSLEIIPADLPDLSASAPDLASVATEALHNRPEIRQSILQLRSAVIRLRMQRNELLPQLDLVGKFGLNGLAEDRIDNAYDRQYSEGGPSYGLGLTFTYPIENNFAKARYTRRRIEVRQQIEQVNTTIETVLLEAKVALREFVTAQRDLRAKYAAAASATAELRDLNQRKTLDTGLGATPPPVTPAGAAPSTTTPPPAPPVSDYLDRLLDSQSRHSFAREEFLRSLTVFNVAAANLQRAKGSFLNFEDISIQREKDPEKLQILKLYKNLFGDKNPVIYDNKQVLQAPDATLPPE